MSARAILGSGADVKTARVEGQVAPAKTNASVAAGEEEEGETDGSSSTKGADRGRAHT
jgi:hypothetical protein